MDRMAFVESAQLAARRLREAVRLLPELPGLHSDPDLYGVAGLRAAIEDGSFPAAVSVLADVGESVRWANLAALHATQTSGALRAAGWSLDERRAVAAVRDPLRAAVAHTYTASMVLDDARRRCGREFVR